MGKFLKSLTDGSLRCSYCGDKKCDCLEDGRTTLGFVGIWRYPPKRGLYETTFIQLKRQVLPNGKKIPSGTRVFVPHAEMMIIDEVLKTVSFNNEFLNKLRFD